MNDRPSLTGAFAALPIARTPHAEKPLSPQRVSKGMPVRRSPLVCLRSSVSARAGWFALLLCLAAGLLGSNVASAQMTPDAPIENFRLPMFGDEGYRIWDLRGDEALYLSANRIDVIGMRLRVFSGGAEEHVDSLIESPEARVLIDRNEARGEKGIKVTGHNHEATGEEWSWHRHDNRILIRNDVRVTFYEELEGFLISIP